MVMPTISERKNTLRKNANEFVYFSPQTAGKTGRSVKIDRKLFFKFFCAVDPATHDGQFIVRQIENLRAAPSHPKVSPRSGNNGTNKNHATLLNNLSNAFEHVLICKNVHVYYMVSQEQVDKSPGVYITEVREIHRGGSEAAGLYEKKGGGPLGNKSLKKSTSPLVDGKTVYINGFEKSLEKAYDAALNETQNNTTALFYSPSAVMNDLGSWGANIRSQVTHNTVKELVSVLKNNASPKQGIKWVVEGQGAAVLNQAFNQYTGTLKNHEFKFINPEADTPKLLQTLTQKGAALTGEFFNYSRSKSALTAITVQKEAIVNHISGLTKTNSYDDITRRYIIEQINTLAQKSSGVVTQNTALKSNGTFLQALKKAGNFRK